MLVMFCFKHVVLKKHWSINALDKLNVIIFSIFLNEALMHDISHCSDLSVPFTEVTICTLFRNPAIINVKLWQNHEPANKNALLRSQVTILSILYCCFFFSLVSKCVCFCACLCVCPGLRNRRSLQGLPVWVDSGIHRENNQKAKDIS